MIKAVVFDLDDTLISEKEYIESGFNIISKEIAKRHNLYSERVYEKMINLFEDSSKNVFNRVLDYFSIKYSNDEILDFINIYRNHKPNIKFYDDVIPTITALKEKEIKVGIITDGYKETQFKKIEVLGCMELFDEIIITDEMGREFWKPNEVSYKLMAERLNINLNEMIYVGDNVNKDFVTANKLGIETIHIDRKNGIYSELDVPRGFLAKTKIEFLYDICLNL
ncbi:HAD-IA family hydrolase [Clostridium sp. D43t1_170807_H7]|uniref:HAD family hydrolase n=1 Tax=Clostridium sp. D43t1_170807_H7 TaxID=2787140 RepID=UPI00189BB977|nr:HAD-IA family hydrolase [Clostridium sp. D43t1_170807_H7]